MNRRFLAFSPECAGAGVVSLMTKAGLLAGAAFSCSGAGPSRSRARTLGYGVQRPVWQGEAPTEMMGLRPFASWGVRLPDASRHRSDRLVSVAQRLKVDLGQIAILGPLPSMGRCVVQNILQASRDPTKPRIVANAVSFIGGLYIN